VPGNDVLNPRLYLGEGSLDGAFVISGTKEIIDKWQKRSYLTFLIEKLQ
jgi:hypothetical protein